MKELNEIRDEMATDWCIEMGVYNKEHFAFQAGFDKGAEEMAKIAKEREAKLVEALEKVIFALQCNIIKHNGKVPTMSDEQVFEASIEIRDQAKQALADHKRMMEGE